MVGRVIRNFKPDLTFLDKQAKNSTTKVPYKYWLCYVVHNRAMVGHHSTVSLEIWRLIKPNPRYQISRSPWYVIMSRGNVIPIETE